MKRSPYICEVIAAVFSELECLLSLLNFTKTTRSFDSVEKTIGSKRTFRFIFIKRSYCQSFPQVAAALFYGVSSFMIMVKFLSNIIISFKFDNL